VNWAKAETGGTSLWVATGRGYDKCVAILIKVRVRDRIYHLTDSYKLTLNDDDLYKLIRQVRGHPDQG
jgi:hypothetical protein